MDKIEVRDKLLAPLMHLLATGKREFTFLLGAVLKRRYVFASATARLVPSDEKIWLKWLAGNAMPRNTQIATIIRTRGHLLQDKIPASFGHYLHYHDWWSDQHARFLAGRPDPAYRLHGLTNYPANLDKDVLRLWQTVVLP